MNKREELKYELFNDIERLGADGSKCEGQSYKKHTCTDDEYPSMNEVLFTKNHFRGKPQKVKDYFANKINCTLMCSGSHTDFGHSHKFRVWFQKRMIKIYGIDAVTDFVDNAPLVIKR